VSWRIEMVASVKRNLEILFCSNNILLFAPSTKLVEQDFNVGSFISIPPQPNCRNFSRSVLDR
jgi:hypothetical protein